jgi:hypothetical protein
MSLAKDLSMLTLAGRAVTFSNEGDRGPMASPASLARFL